MHTVKEGETLGAIAARYETTISGILRLNPEISDPNLIQVGQRIKLPDTITRQYCAVGQVATPSGCAPEPFELGFYWNDSVKSRDAIYAEIFGMETNFRKRSIFDRANEHLGANVLPGEIVIICNMPVTAADRERRDRLKEQARLASEGLRQLTPEEAATVKRHLEIFDFVSVEGVAEANSAGLGVLSAVTGQRLNSLKSVLERLDSAYLEELAKNPSGRFSPDFYQTRQQLFRELDIAANRVTMSSINIRQYSKIKNTLGLSTKSIIHNASEILDQGQVPQLGQRINKVSAWAQGSKGLGWLGVAIDGGVRSGRVLEACRSGNADTCQLVRYQQVGGFALAAGGGAVGGYVGAKAATFAMGVVAVVFGVTLGAPVIAIVALTGAAAGAYAAGARLGGFGEWAGEMLYEIKASE